MARIRLTGDFPQMRQLIRDIAGLSKSAQRKTINEAAGRGALEALETGFATETDPSGRPWVRSIRAQVKGGKTLTDSGTLRGSFRMTAGSRSFVVWPEGSAPSVVYMGTHQFGATIRAKRAKYLRFRLANGRVVQTKQVRIPRRPMLPVGQIPRRWLDLMFAAASRRMSELMPWS